MIEITCTETQKKKIIKALEVMDSPCLFPNSAKFCFLDRDSDCKRCLEKKIKWNIKKRGQKK